MESLKELLMRQGFSGLSCDALAANTPEGQKAYVQAKVDAYNGTEGDLNAQDGYDCRACRNKGFISRVAYSEDYACYHETLTFCRCHKVRQAIERLERSGLKETVEKYTFERYETTQEWQKTLKGKAVAYVQAVKEGAWFFVGGQSGAGKTHLCTAIAAACIRQGMSVKYMLWRDAITNLKAVVNDPNRYHPAMEELKKTDVLYIDDLFKGGRDDFGKLKAPTAADVNAAFEILNYRYSTSRPTIISSERTLDELNEIDEAIAGRIAERAKPGGFCISLRPDPHKNYRMNGITEL